MVNKLFEKPFYKKGWLFSYLLVFFAACSQSNAKTKAFFETFSEEQIAAHYALIEPLKKQIQSGDLIFRNGYDEISAAARSMNRIDTSFSHCGIVFVENDSLVVYHALGGHFNPSRKLLRDPIDHFLIPEETNRMAIYRYQLSSVQLDSLQQIAKRHYANEVKFDTFFNLDTDLEMYCSEFVYKTFNKALNDSLALLISPRPWPLGITPDDLYLNERSKLVKRIELAQNL